MTDRAPPERGSADHGPNAQLDERRRSYEARYAREAEPWSYGASGAETLRHARVVEIARRHKPVCRTALDLGCSLGQFTERLIGYASVIVAIDIAPTAVARARERCEARLAATPRSDTRLEFRTGTATAIPAPDASVDVAFYLDGIAEHQLTDEGLAEAAAELERVLAADGLVIFTDYMQPRDFAAYAARIGRLGFEVVETIHFHDRPWFRLKSWFKAVPRNPIVDGLLASERIAAALARLGSLAGAQGSKHLGVVARPSGWR